MVVPILLSRGRVILHNSLGMKPTPHQQCDEQENQHSNEDHAQHFVLEDDVVAPNHFWSVL